MTVSATDWPASPLAAADAAFAALTREPAPLTLDLEMFSAAAGLPGGVVALPALRDWLLAHPRAYPARDTVWRELIRRARLEGPAWVIAAVGMAMPALRRYAAQLTARLPRRPGRHRRRNPHRLPDRAARPRRPCPRRPARGAVPGGVARRAPTAPPSSRVHTGGPH